MAKKVWKPTAHKGRPDVIKATRQAYNGYVQALSAGQLLTRSAYMGMTNLWGTTQGAKAQSEDSVRANAAKWAAHFGISQAHADVLLKAKLANDRSLEHPDNPEISIKGVKARYQDREAWPKEKDSAELAPSGAHTDRRYTPTSSVGVRSDH